MDVGSIIILILTFFCSSFVSGIYIYVGFSDEDISGIVFGIFLLICSVILIIALLVQIGIIYIGVN